MLVDAPVTLPFLPPHDSPALTSCNWDPFLSNCLLHGPAHRYHKLYLQSKGNVYKNKRVLIEHIHYEKAEAARSKALAQAAEAHKNKVRAAKARRAERKAAKAQAAREAYDRQVKGIKA